MEKDYILSEEAIKQFADSLTPDQDQSILRLMSLEKIQDYHKLLKTIHDLGLLSAVKGNLILAKIDIPARILNDNRSTVSFLGHLSARLSQQNSL